MDQITFTKKIGFAALTLALLEINVRPYSKNFILPPEVDESLIERISRISRSSITIDLGEKWVDDRLITILKSSPSLNYNIIISGYTGQPRINNIKRLSPSKIGFIVDRFIDESKIRELNMLKPYGLYLIYKRLPESFELSEIKKGRIREILVFLDTYSAYELINKSELFSDMRIALKPVQKEALDIICNALNFSQLIKIYLDDRIFLGDSILDNIDEKCRDKIVFETSSLTYYNKFMQFIRSGIYEINIYYDQNTPQRNSILNWILMTDP